MAQFPVNHNSLYFDSLCRTKKGESVLSLIHATYQAKMDAKDGDDVKKDIAERLAHAYELFKGTAGSYNGDVGQFSSQYTIGHELCIWKNSELDLTDLAIQVAENKITIRDYFDIVFLNYIQPVNKKIVHVLYHLLKYMNDNNLTSVTKEEMGAVYRKIGNATDDGNVNGAFNMLVATNYFSASSRNQLDYVAPYSIRELMGRCDTTYVGMEYETVKEALKDNATYIEYMLKDSRIIDEGENNATPELVDSKAENILLYGVPGCGKSNEIKTKYCSDDNYMERVVFHPDYTYSDFVGQVMPTSDGTNISYPFIPGPFTRILRKATKPENKDNMYYLVIEEINRGNAPAIFGDIFQLLDRNAKGESEYGITNADIADIVHGNKEQKVKIPGNLTILATMNSSDQNVFTLDTAFKRRWKMRSIKNDIEGCKHADAKICGTSISWKEFATKINEIIIELGKDNLGSEDNRLGAYFVQRETLNNPEEFAEKVLMYLWNDAIKYDRDKVFVSTYRTLDELIDGFKKHKFKVFLDSVGFEDANVVMEVQEDNNGETTEVGE